jgi:capsular polysaccharide biosynthesis protein
MELMGGDTGLGAGLLAGAEGALLRKVMDSGTVGDLYVGILESRAVADAIIDRFDLIDVYEVKGQRFKAARRLRKNTRTKVSDEGIVYLSVEDVDPNRAAAIANAYVEELDAQNKRLSGGEATNKRIFLQNRLKEIEDKLSRIETIPSHEARVQEMLYELLVQRLELAKIEEAKSMPTVQILDPAVPPEVRKAKGTVRRAVLAGVAALMFLTFIAFGREYLAVCRARERQIRATDRNAHGDADSASYEMSAEPGVQGTPQNQGQNSRPVPDSVGSARD